MRYQALSRGGARIVREHLIEGKSFDLAGLSEDVGEGNPLDATAIEEIENIAIRASGDIESGADPEAVEHQYSGEVYLALRKIPVGIRDDRGFWSWLTLGPLLPLTRKREVPPKLETLGIGSNPTDILGLRMFLRGQVSRVVQEDGSLDFELATAPGTSSHDFWQSHLLRRSTGAERDLARALIERQSDSETRMVVGILRPFVRDRINRKKRTRATFLMTEVEATEYLEHEFISQLGIAPFAEEDDDEPTTRGRAGHLSEEADDEFD